MKKSYPPFWPTLVLAVAKFALQLFGQHADYELHRDEYLYLDQGNHLAWGFLEVPPAQSIQAFFSQLAGNGLYAVRFWPALWGSLMLIAAGLIVVELGGKVFAQLLTGLCIVCSAYLRIDSLFQPNALDSLVWTAGFLVLIRLLKTGNRRLLIQLAVVGAVGVLNKYAAGFFLMGIFVALLFSPRRKVLLSGEALIALGVFLLLLSPNLFWQWRNNIPFLQHMRLLRESQLVNISPTTFLLEQAFLCLPGLWVWTVGLWTLLFSRKDRLFRPVGVVYLVVIGILLILHGKGYYAVGLYPTMLAAGSVVWERLTQAGTWRLVWRGAMLLLPVDLLIPMFPILFPAFSPLAMTEIGSYAKPTGFLRWEDGKDHPLPQDYADMLGWEELAQLVQRAYLALPPAERARTLIFTGNYGEAGALNYYAPKYGLPPTYSFNSSYKLWLPRNPPLVNLIIVDDEPDEDLPGYFRSYRTVGAISNPLAREQGTQVILAEGARKEFRNRFLQSAREHRREWNLPEESE